MIIQNNLRNILEAGRFAVTADIRSPQNADVQIIYNHLNLLNDFVDAYNVTDNQGAVVQLSSLAAGLLIQKSGKTAVVHMTCRDRNRLGIQSDLLGAYALGIQNILCLSGDHPRLGNQPDSKSVYDIDSIQLINLIREMRDNGKLFGGEECSTLSNFYIGTTVNPFAEPFEFRVSRLEKKINAGANFVQTKPVFDIELFDKFMGLVRARDLHKKASIIAGIMPIKSIEMAELALKRNTGILIPDSYIKRLTIASNQEAEGLKICLEQIKQLREIEGVAGIHLMSTYWDNIVPVIVKQAGLYPRPQLKKVAE